MSETVLLGAAQIRQLAKQLDVTPTKKLGQNFVIDPNTVSRIANEAHLNKDDVVLEVGPGLGSLTLAMLDKVSKVIAIEVDPRLASELPKTVAKFAPNIADRLIVINQDAMQITELPAAPTKLVANLPYNISVPVVLHLLHQFPTITEVLVMVQLEVAQRMAALPGSKIYGVPSVKIAWYGKCELAGNVGRNVFWPAPNVDSGLVRITKSTDRQDETLRQRLFQIVDGAFGQRRKTLRSSLSNYFGSSVKVDEVLAKAGVASSLRGEQLDLNQFLAIAKAAGE
ncbi:MAG: rRNA ((1518)-N(6)/adenine(1519)-N(6))-dimethyltransferase RsmA [Actinomycetota bacterium]